MVNKIVNSVQNEKEVGMAITRALIALEDKYYFKAIEEAHNALQRSEYIEQRLCLIAIRDVALSRDENRVRELLEEAYNY